MENIMNSEIFENNGNVNISDEVVAVIASLAASEIKGIAGMVSGVVGGIAELIGKKNDPILQGTNGILTVGFVVVLLLCSVGFLIFWIYPNIYIPKKKTKTKRLNLPKKVS